MKKTLLLLVALITATIAFAQIKINGIYYYLDDETKTAGVTYQSYETGKKNYYSLTSISIPEKVTYNATEYSVTEIGYNAFADCSSLTSISIPNSVTVIDDYAFVSCTSLTSISIPNSVTEIRYGAFFDCSALTSISIPNSVTVIGVGAFSNCSSLTSISIPNSVTEIGYGAFENCSALTSISIPNSVTEIGQETFSGCTSLTSISIPNSVTMIGSWAFDDTPFFNNQPNGPIYINNLLYTYKGEMPANTHIDIEKGTTTICDRVFDDCKSLTSVSIPNSVTVIGYGAFSDCTSLTSISIPNSVTVIDGSAFEGCTSLTSISIPNSVTEIESSAFSGCSSLTFISIPNSVTSIGGEAFSSCKSLTSISIPNSVTVIRDKAFEGCSSLTSISIPNSVTEIGYQAFYGCSSLNAISIPNSVTEIRYGAFWGCSSLISISIPNSVTTIGLSAFYGCSSLSSISIPNSVTGIENGAFSDCSALTSISIPNSVTEIGGSAFSGCSSLTSISIPNSVTEIGGGAFHGTPFLDNQPDGPIYINNCLYKYKGKMPANTHIDIKEGTTTICDYAFEDCSSLSSISIPNSVTEIGYKAFAGCSSLTSISIPNSVTEIGRKAFEGCSSLTSISIPNSVTEIGYDAFYGCQSLSLILIHAKNPPAMSVNRFPNSISVRIPKGCIDKYKTAEGWSYITNYEEFDQTVNNILIDNIYYSLNLKNKTAEISHTTKQRFNNNETNTQSNITIPSKVSFICEDYNVIAIKEEAFYNCKHLTSVTIENGITEIGPEAFSNCSSLSSISIPNSVTNIDKTAFSNTLWLENQPDGVIYINTLLYKYKGTMQKNQHIVVKEGTTKICEDAFSNYSLLESVFIPSSVTEIERYAFYNCYSLQSIDVDQNNLNYASINGVLYDKNITTIIFCPAAKKKITIPNSVTSIGGEAFSYCSALSSINIDKNNLNYTDIKGVLYDKNITTLILCPKDQKKITIPSSVTSIEDNAFTNCTSLTSITIQTENPPTVHQNAFTKVPTSVTIKVPKGSIEKYKTANIWDSFTNYEEF